MHQIVHDAFTPDKENIGQGYKLEIRQKSQCMLECDEDIQNIRLNCSTPTKDNKPASASFISEIHNNFAQSVEYPPSQKSLALWTVQNPDHKEFLMQKEKQYPRWPVEKSIQPNITYSMRVILMDWMMEVSSEFTLKRETFHQALHHVDRFLAVYPNVAKQQFQLIGLTALYIAAKNEEIYSPKLADFERAADSGYDIQEIKVMERLIMGKLQWKMIPITPITWINWMMNHWDSYIDFHFGCVLYNNSADIQKLPEPDKSQEFARYENRFITFKQANKTSYKRFRETVQILDLAILDSHILQFDNRIIAGGLLYLMISKYFYDTDYELLQYNGPDMSAELIGGDENSIQYENAMAVQELYQEFAKSAVDIQNLEEVHPVVEFMHGFLELQVCIELPQVCKILSRSRLESHYEEFLSYQTHNSDSLEFVTNRVKGI